MDWGDCRRFALMLSKHKFSVYNVFYNLIWKGNRDLGQKIAKVELRKELGSTRRTKGDNKSHNPFNYLISIRNENKNAKESESEGNQGERSS